jgi:hypothetical protein
MPYDITDAKEDIALLSAKIDSIVEILKEKKIIEEKKNE